MKDWLLRMVLEWVVANLTKERVEKWAEAAKNYVVPKLRSWGDELFKSMRAEAAKSETQLDDAAVDAAEKFWDALLPDTESHL